MSLSDLEMLFKFVGGLGMFLYGMNVMAEGLQKTAGTRLKKLMNMLTRNRLMAVLLGAFVTAIIQSSSATTVMVVGFVNAGLMNLTQAVGVIMGANIGTTITAWIVSMGEWASVLKPDFFAPFLVGIGAFMMLFTRSDKKKSIAELLIGFGVLFVGLSFMSESIIPYKDSHIFSTIFTTLGRNPLLAIVAGTVVTAIIQSSSASVGVLQTLAANGIVNWKAAVFITLGQNIGTCITAILASVGAQRTAKRAACIHLLFNVLGAVVFSGILMVVFYFNPLWGMSTISSTQISIFHTIFNVTVTIILFPFAQYLVKLSGILIKGKVEELEDADDVGDELELKLDERMFETPAFAIEAATSEITRMGELVLKSTKSAVKGLVENDEKSTKKVFKYEKLINQYEKELTEFLVRIDTLSLSDEQYEEMKNLMRTIGDLERIGDHSENLAELSEQKIKGDLHFSQVGKSDLVIICEVALNALSAALVARNEHSIEAARKVGEYEGEVDEMEKELREKHIERLSHDQCVIESGIVFFDALSNLERISDHAYNIAGYVLSESGELQSGVSNNLSDELQKSVYEASAKFDII